MLGARIRVDKTPEWSGNNIEIRVTTHGEMPGDYVCFNHVHMEAGLVCTKIEATFEKPTLTTQCVPAALVLLEQQAQQLIDGLWDCGFRPKNAVAVGETAAIKDHLEDCREITKRMIKLVEDRL